MSTPPAKKVKVDATPDLHAVAQTAWEHYRNYVESTEESDGEGDTDELEEMISVVFKPNFSSIRPLNSMKDLTVGNATTSESIISTEAFLPVLLSVAYYHLADVAIGECLELSQQASDEGTVNDGRNDEKSQLVAKCKELIEQAIRWYPENAAMWSMGANFGRMFQVLDPSSVCHWYELAAKCAVQVRSEALEILEDRNQTLKLKDTDAVKEWIELLLMNIVAGVEYVVDDGDDEAEERENKQQKEEESEDQQEEGYFTSSSVEATARFMAAMLHSTAAKHDEALSHLHHFPVTHRVHPQVWQHKQDICVSPTSNDSPVKYKGANGILPPELYQRMCHVFAPEAAYWKESDYNHRGYYSYFMDIPGSLQKNNIFTPNNLMEDVIWNHLYPLVQKEMLTNTQICGAEWWVHTRPIKANLGHNLHFDTDEALLAQEKEITHPIYSSVLYLTGGPAGGATIVFDQSPDSEIVASQAWRCVPEDNTFLIFPGNMLHGVLPCPGMQQDEVISDKTTTSGNVKEQWLSQTAKLGDKEPNRLTFLVGFWTRRVPDKMKTRRLYGPCGPLPPRPNGNKHGGKGHTWVEAICRNYDSAHPVNKPNMNITSTGLPVVAPAWESIQSNKDTLQLPKAIDHRFFVQDAPKCFRDSLFERSEVDDNDEGEQTDGGEDSNFASKKLV